MTYLVFHLPCYACLLSVCRVEIHEILGLHEYWAPLLMQAAVRGMVTRRLYKAKVARKANTPCSECDDTRADLLHSVGTAAPGLVAILSPIPHYPQALVVQLAARRMISRQIRKQKEKSRDEAREATAKATA